MSIDEIYRLVQFVIKKNQQGFFKPADFNIAFNQAQISYQSWLLGSLQQYMPGRAIAKVELGQNSVVTQTLSPVTTKPASITIAGNGKSVYPVNYLQVNTMTTTAFKTIRYSLQNQLPAYYNSTIDPILTNPIYLLEDTGFQFYPITLGFALLSYIKKAPDVVWAYTLDGNGRPIYNAGGSTDPVWDDIAIFDIVARVLRMIGVNLQDNQISAYAEQVRNTGQ